MKSCLDCGMALHGRSDKKFCNDQCRNNYNNQLNSENYALIRKVNNLLRRNKRILEQLSPAGKTKVARRKLVEMNFSFDYFTNIYRTNSGNTYFFCYDYGYLILDDDVLIVQKQDRSQLQRDKGISGSG